jgi:hypothetical protein
MSTPDTIPTTVAAAIYPAKYLNLQLFTVP